MAARLIGHAHAWVILSLAFALALTLLPGYAPDVARSAAMSASEPVWPLDDPSVSPDPSASSDPSQSPGPTPPPPLPSLIETASAAPAPALPSSAFRTTKYALPRLAWASLPYNNLTLLPTTPIGTNNDADGLPYKVVNGKNYYNPGTIAMHGCRYLDAYVRTGKPIYLEIAQRHAKRLRLLGSGARSASWLAYKFPYGEPGLGLPWVSALAQGTGLSFFTRLYRVTGSAADLATARKLFLSFRALGRSKPWVGYVDMYGYLRLEEYPGSHPSHVFNGANFGYFGVYDYAMLTGDPTAVQLARGHLTAMRHYAGRYRVPGGLSYYDLVHYTRSVHYHAVDRWQLLMLGKMGGGTYFTGLYRLFKADYAGGWYP
jgi:hypothetical protein